MVLETDCARMANIMQAKGEDRLELCFLITEIREVGQSLPGWRAVKVKREVNRVAHELAQLARQNTKTEVWLGQTPACVQKLLTTDCDTVSD